jgi:hypothetical protein
MVGKARARGLARQGFESRQVFEVVINKARAQDQAWQGKGSRIEVATQGNLSRRGKAS